MSTQEAPYLNPFTDFGFKKLFGSEPNKELLIDFLNSLLPERHKIATLSYVKNEQLGRSIVDRKAIFDLFCESERGDKFIVEVQKAKQNFFKERSVYYATFPIQEQAKKGEWDFNLSAVYTIGILDFVFDEDKNDDKFFYEVKLLDTEDYKVFYDKLTFMYLELPKFKKNEDELVTHFDKWLYVLKHLHRLTSRPPQLQERVFERLFEAASIAKLAPDEYEAYEESLKVYRDLKNVVDTSYMEGKAEGKAEGKIEGKNEKAIEIARAMKEKSLSLEMIASLTGLSIEEIEKL